MASTKKDAQTGSNPLIKMGENDRGYPGINKFHTKKHEGMPGKMIAINKNSTKAVVIALATAIKGDVKWGKMYLVEEVNAGEYPIVVRNVSGVPDEDTWQIIADIPKSGGIDKASHPDSDSCLR